MWSEITQASNWSTFDITTVNPNADGFFGAAYDGRYVYFVPAFKYSSDGVVARYDTRAAFNSSGSWSTFDVATLNPSAVGFAGGAFDGRYIYLVPNWKGVASAHGVVVRYDTQVAFTSPGSWSTFDVTTVYGSAKGFVGAAFDGRYIDFVPFNNGFFDGVAARHNTQAAFTSAGSWSTFDVATLDPRATGFRGAAFDGRYVYLVPEYGGGFSGVAGRYDTQAAFTSSGSWSTFDVATVNAKARGFSGAAFDGRYVYLAPWFATVVARYDAQAAFTGTGSWSMFDLTTASPSAKAFSGAAFDGRYVYLVPFLSGMVARYDIQAAFTNAGSWSTFDVATVNATAQSFNGAAFDGRYVYLVPGLGGVAARFDAKSPPSMPVLPGWFSWGPGSFF
jgi:hypothetical protein